jgi:cell division protein FtsW
MALPVVWICCYTLVKGTVIAGANASRWIQVPFIGISFQTSTLASVVLFIFVARYLSKTRRTITLSLHFGTLVACVYYSDSYFTISLLRIDFCNDTYVRVY